MNVFVDSSALIAFLIAEDDQHENACLIWDKLSDAQALMVTTNYIVVETCSLLQRRSGMSVVQTFLRDVLPVVALEWVDLSLHTAAMSAFLGAGRRGPSIVDSVSFAAMRRLGLTTAFAFDEHFVQHGFSLAS